MARRKKKGELEVQPPPLPVKQMTTEEAFEQLRRQANHGDPVARKALIQFLDANPWLWERFGDVAGLAEKAVIEHITRGEWLTSEAIRRTAVGLHRLLAGPAPSPLKELAAQRVVVTWLALQDAEMRAAQAQRDREWATFWLRKRESADRMYRAALASLNVIEEKLSSCSAPAPAPGIVMTDTFPSAKPTSNRYRGRKAG